MRRVTAVTLRVTDQASQMATCSATVTVTPFSIGAAFGFEEASGSTVLDSSGNQNNGSFNPANGPQRVAAGRFGKGMLFDGIDDLITVADSNSPQSRAIRDDIPIMLIDEAKPF